MRKPAMVAVIGLVCMAAAVTETKGLGLLGATLGAQVLGDAAVEISALRPGGQRSFAQIPASQGAYGLGYPYVQ